MKFKKDIFNKDGLQRKLHLVSFLALLVIYVNAQPFTFAHVTDTHVGGATGAEDLQRTVADINSLPEIEFVLLTGDVTEFGSGEELSEAKNILDRLNKPYYVVPGNHDSKWSESGCNDFARIFGSETFAFEKNGYLFIGTASGPDMRMAPAMVPREQMLFLDSIMSSVKNPEQPIFYINHYPLDESLSNSSDVIGLLRTTDIQVCLLGHGHSNRLLDFEGIPGVMGRSNLRAGSGYGGYNICTVRQDTLYYEERITGRQTNPIWCKIPLNINRSVSTTAVRKHPVNSVNSDTLKVRPVWEFQENSDIGSGIAAKGNICVCSSTDGRITARHIDDGKFLWEFITGGKIFSTPAIQGNRVVCPSTDKYVYCIDLKKGKLLWSIKTGRSVVASPAIRKKNVYTGSSEGIFRANRLKNGELAWQFDSIRNFVETRPLLYKHAVYFGSWGNSFYALDQKTGALLWKREKYNNRMLSPAAVWPVASKGKIFIVAPDRHITALDAGSGREIWDSGKYSCRESIGMSKNKKLVYIKNMTEGNVDAFYAKPDSQIIAWECKTGLGYEIAPSPITEKDNLIFVPTTSGIIYAINRKNHQVEWKYKVSDALINYVLPISGQRILVTAFDGKVACLQY